MSASSTNLKTSKLISVNQNVGQVVFQNELQKLVAGAGDCPAILLMVINNQTMGFRSIPELAVMVGIASAARQKYKGMKKEGTESSVPP